LREDLKRVLVDIQFMANALKKFMICMIVGTLIFLPGSVAQVRKRSICGKVVLNTSDAVAKTEVMLDYAGIELNPAVIADRDGAFCIDNFVGDLSQSATARLYAASFCRPDDVMLVAAPFWPVLRKERRFAGKDIVIERGDLTRVGDVYVQLIYGHVSLRILDRRHQPLLTRSTDWSPVWIKVKKQDGVAVHESGLSLTDIERSVHLRESRIDLALPKGTWTIEIALAGVPPNTGRIRRAVRWLRVAGKVKIESCAKPVDLTVTASRPTKS
jgi:hypothetical protein